MVPRTPDADFAVPDKRLAIYIDGAAFHVGVNLKRDKYLRDKLRNGEPPWTVVELRAKDLWNDRYSGTNDATTVAKIECVTEIGVYYGGIVAIFVNKPCGRVDIRHAHKYVFT